jgi:hypothetical protein
LPEAAKPVLHLQLSSPIEEGTISQIFDPLNQDPAPEGSAVVFKGVEISMATLTVSAKDIDIPLGSSVPHDVAPICSINPMEVKDEYVTEIPVAIVAESSAEASATAETTDEAGGDSAEATSTASATAEVIVPICTVTLKITYKPSPKDQREELYEILNKTSQRKATALENLRKISMSLVRESSSPTKGGTVVKSSVKPGFLNKKQKEATRMEKLYERTIGPDSILRKGLGVAVVARNYLIFVGAVTLFHFKGQMLALPPPV